LGSDVAKRAAWLLFRARLDPASPLYRCPQVLFAHDEFVTVVRRGSAHPCPAHVLDAKGKCKRCDGGGSIWPLAEWSLAEQERIMIAASAEWCPDVPIKVESMITDRYKK